MGPYADVITKFSGIDRFHLLEVWGSATIHLRAARNILIEGQMTNKSVQEIQGKSILVRVGARFELSGAD